MRAISVFLFSLLSFSVFSAAPKLNFKLSDKVNIYSDKGYRRLNENIYEAIGNVIIINGKDTLYGEMASLDMDKKQMQVEGNVRITNEEMTIYGSNLDYNFKNDALKVSNGRIVTNAYYVYGKKLERVSPGEFYAEEAEYTTCRDCPESWLIYGKRVRVNPGKYIHIHHALLKVNGTVIMYLPYMAIPIKSQRETGLLFPSFQISLSRGITYEQPWFWAISDNKDLTLTPAVYGKRGSGGRFQYRHVLWDKSWLELNNLGLFDRIFLPGRTTEETSGTHYGRFFLDAESHIKWDDFINAHVYHTEMRDVDMVNDFGWYTADRITGTDVGLESYLELRNEYFTTSLEFYNRHNLLTDKYTEFDNSYVQIAPSLNISSRAFNLLQTDIQGFRNISVGLRSGVDVFKQNKNEEGLYLRNVTRTRLDPYIDWKILNFNGFLYEARYDHEYLHYRFRNNNLPSFRKTGGLLTNSFSFEIDKVFGLAYKDTVKIKPQKQNLNKKVDTSGLVGNLEDFTGKNTTEEIIITKNSYRHSQEYRFNHLYTVEQEFDGNSQFFDQISNQAGLFDYRDAILTKQNLLGTNIARTGLSPRNTLELQWNNFLTRKSANRFIGSEGDNLHQAYTYSQLAFFKVSQGLELNTGREKVIDDLTRLNIQAGFSLASMSFFIDDYYFHQTSQHIFTSSIRKGFDQNYIGADYFSNSFTTPKTSQFNLIFGYRPMDVWELEARYMYDFEKNDYIGGNYSIGYKPLNNCWRVRLNYESSIVQTRFAINFAINYSDNRFTSFGNQGQGQ